MRLGLTCGLNLLGFRESLAVADHPGGDSCGDGHRGQVVGDDGSGAYDGSVADGDARGDYDVGTEPDVVADVDGGIAARLVADEVSTGDAVIGGDD